MNRFLTKTSLFIFLYTILFAFLSFFYLQKLSAFGCFDDCNNFLGGYFLLKDKQIFSDFFFNHAPFMAYLSFAIQKLTGPSGIYELILYHRLFLLFFSYFFGVLLILRFGKIAFFSLILFESTKYYIFGDRFLAESFIVYMLVYLFGLSLLKATGSKLKDTDYYISALFCWAVIFTREPFIPLTLSLLFVILLGKMNKARKISVLMFLGLTALTILLLPIKEMIENVYIYNNEITSSELKEKGGILKVILTSFFYPLYVFIKGNQSIFRILEQIISIVFIASVVKAIIEKKFKLIALILFVLCLSNIRFVSPGEMFYGSFHMVVWYALFIYSTLFLIYFLKFNFYLRSALIILLILIPVISFVSKESFITFSNNKNDEFSLSYNNYFVYGNTINNLSDSNDSIFLEERDDLIYWVANLNSSYRYQWYTSLMPSIKKYRTERDLMFISNSPDFYYDACLLKQRGGKDPEGYIRIPIYNAPSCLLVKSSKLKEIPKEKWGLVSGLGFAIPE